ncbi:hypothetical protein GGU11DRAFT_852486 [Lentinula aff. detonsa]|nr:hypothetical protein GGU11DRAFT_852486 [Lentinula aff. detonsa]
MQKATEKVAKARRPSPHAKPWWDETCMAAINRVRRAQRDARRYRMENGFADSELMKAIKHEDNHYHRLVKFKKGTWATKTIEEAHPDDMWGFRKWSKGTRNYPMPAIQRVGRPPATTHEEKCEALREELYQPAPRLPRAFEVNLSDVDPQDIPFHDITDTEISEALADTNNTSAPGPSQQGYQQGRLPPKTMEEGYCGSPPKT